MNGVAIKQNNKIHPHKFVLWVAIGSIIMTFAGLTSAYIVKRNQPKWQSYDIAPAFWISTVVIIASSVLLMLAVKAFKNRQIPKYRGLMLGTGILGLIFVALQVIGFKEMIGIGQTMQANASYGFIYVIVGLHALHVIGGVIALWVMTAKAFSTKKKVFSNIPLEVMATYWHFVDILWIYLLLFLIVIK